MEKFKPIVGITIGDLNGIGPEIVLKTLEDRRILDFVTPVIFANEGMLKEYRKTLKISDFKLNVWDGISKVNRKVTNVYNCWKDKVTINSGELNEKYAEHTRNSIELATDMIVEGKIDSMVTAPINKNLLSKAGFEFPGHTEYFGHRAEQTPQMVLCSEVLRITPVTGHLPLNDVAGQLSEERILETITDFHKTLMNDFGISKPKIAVLGLNPHAGENGLLGDEEKRFIIPAIKQAKTKEILAFGPYPTDGFFGASTHHKFDGVVAMYHDQALAPFKMLSFDEGVNYTAGLSFVRTSPDHGTAYDIAGQNKASENSFRQALFLAGEIVHRRNSLLVS